MATFFLDYEGGNDANDGTTFANRWKTITSGATAARIAPGDTIRIMGSPAPTSLGINTTWTNLSPTITLASALTQSISLCNAAWTASTNVTTATNSSRKEGSVSTSIALGAAFTTGKAARESFATLDLSGYQQVSFWIRQTAGTVAIAADLTLRLCSDTAGDVTVDTITIPGLAALNEWTPFTIDTGGALGSSIQSVALYVAVDRGAQTFLLDNIMACKASSSADALCLVSLIGKPNSVGAGGTDTETWYGIRSINGTTVILDMLADSSAATTSQGYYGTSETVTGYRRLPIRTTLAALSTTVVQEVQDSGTSGNLINFEGGWDRTAMTTQNLETWFDGGNGLGIGLQLSSKDFVSVNKLSFIRYDTGFILLSSDSNVVNNMAVGSNTNNFSLTGATLNNISNIYSHNGGGSGGITIVTNSDDNTFTSIKADSNGSTGLLLNTATGNAFVSVSSCSNNGGHGIQLSNANENVFTTITTVDSNDSWGINLTSSFNNTFTTIGSVSNNTSSGISFSGAGYNKFGTITSLNDNGVNGIHFGTTSDGCSGNLFSSILAANNNDSSAVFFNSASENNILTISTSGNANEAISVETGRNYFRNSTFAETLKVDGFFAFANGKIFSKNDQNVVGAFKIYCDGGDILTDTSTVHTTGTSWKMSPTSTNRSSTYPLEVSLARLAVNANKTAVVRAWVRRDNTGITARLIAKGGQLNGVTSDVTATASASANTWEQLSITFTPTENGSIEIIGQAWGGTTFNCWWDDLTITQG